MNDDQAMAQPHRARAVAELPLERVLERSDELARRWAIALVLARPLERLADVPLEELSREAPALCAQVLRALRSDSELDALLGGARSPAEAGASPGFASRVGEIAGARGAGALVQAVEALREVLWTALAEHLDEPAFEHLPPRCAADACDRLAFVCSRVLASSIASQLPGEPAPSLASPLAGGAAAVAASRERRVAPARPALPPALRRASSSEPAFAPEALAQGALASRARAVIVDERAPRAAQRVVAEAGRPIARSATGERPTAPPARREIEARDERAERAAAPWLAAIARELERHRRTGGPFGVVAIELRPVALAPARSLRPALVQDVERVLSAELRQAARTLAAGPGGALRAGPAAGALAREGTHRFWLVAPQTARAEAGQLVRRLERALARVAGSAGPVQVAIGRAVCPEDGTDAPTLAATAARELALPGPAGAQGDGGGAAGGDWLGR